MVTRKLRVRQKLKGQLLLQVHYPTKMLVGLRNVEDFPLKQGSQWLPLRTTLTRVSIWVEIECVLTSKEMSRILRSSHMLLPEMHKL